MSDENERSVASTGSVEPLAWAVEDSSGVFAVDLSFSEMERRRERASFKSPCSIVPLYRSPTLTDAEREAINWAAEIACTDDSDDFTLWNAGIMQRLLERTK